MNQPVRQRPRPPARGGGDPAVIFFVTVAGIFLVFCWPAIVWHGYTDTGGWRRDIHSTVAVAVWLGLVAFIAGLIWLGNRSPRPARRPVTPDRLPPPPTSVAARPVCRHGGKVPVDLFTGERVAYLCPDCDTQLDEKGQPS